MQTADFLPATKERPVGDERRTERLLGFPRADRIAHRRLPGTCARPNRLPLCRPLQPCPQMRISTMCLTTYYYDGGTILMRILLGVSRDSETQILSLHILLLGLNIQTACLQSHHSPFSNRVRYLNQGKCAKNVNLKKEVQGTV